MPPPPPRRVWLRVFQNIVRSLTPAYIRASSEGGGKYIGDDHLGNKYFEKPADPDRGRRIPTRYFQVPDRSNFAQECLPAEWDSWLRGRRRLPPSEEEVKRNLQIAMLKKHNADQLALQRGQPMASEVPKYSGHQFPVYEEYEVNPGQNRTGRDTDVKPSNSKHLPDQKT